MSQIIGIALILLWTRPAASFCYQANNIGQIEFNLNSSFFTTKDKQFLDKVLKEHSQTASLNRGYLLLEFSVNKNNQSDKLNKYNMWLAERRIA